MCSCYPRRFDRNCKLKKYIRVALKRIILRWMSLMSILNFRNEPRSDDSHHLFKIFHINDSPGNQKKTKNEKLISMEFQTHFCALNHKTDQPNTRILYVRLGKPIWHICIWKNKPFLINALRKSIKRIGWLNCYMPLIVDMHDSHFALFPIDDPSGFLSKGEKTAR